MATSSSVPSNGSVVSLSCPSRIGVAVLAGVVAVTAGVTSAPSM